jgi:hypothetical protein
LEPLRDPACFAPVRLNQDTGTIVWPNGEEMGPDELYRQAKASELL